MYVQGYTQYELVSWELNGIFKWVLSRFSNASNSNGYLKYEN